MSQEIYPKEVNQSNLPALVERAKQTKKRGDRAFFGMIISIVGCYQGFKTFGGAEGVGRATRNSVVTSTILIILADYIMGAFILALWK